MVALDLEPYSIVEHDGFKRFVEGLQPRYSLPSRNYIARTAIPEMYDAVHAAVRLSLDDAKHVSFTTDIWTCDHSNQAYLSLTAHWINQEMERKMAVLQVHLFQDQHTSDNIRLALQEMLVDWGLDKKVTMLK